MIKNFDQYKRAKDGQVTEVTTNSYSYISNKKIYDDALEESKNHYESEKIAIHEYYMAAFRRLAESHVIEIDEKNQGKLT